MLAFFMRHKLITYIQSTSDSFRSSALSSTVIWGDTLELSLLAFGILIWIK